MSPTDSVYRYSSSALPGGTATYEHPRSTQTCRLGSNNYASHLLLTTSPGAELNRPEILRDRRCRRAAGGRSVQRRLHLRRVDPATQGEHHPRGPQVRSTATSSTLPVVPGSSSGTVDPGSKAEASGVVPNDIITSVNGQPTPTVPVFRQVLAGMRAGRTVPVVINRGGSTTTRQLILGRD
ncbi:PDZ domain-containing protein [Actinoallomurus vinaceus]|uniref:PDZ domain-containing protein n=1 Tax=Actinoallomurus vinaceus TaxID=1080074 RepID=UPI0031EE826A